MATRSEIPQRIRFRIAVNAAIDPGPRPQHRLLQGGAGINNPSGERRRDFAGILRLLVEMNGGHKELFLGIPRCRRIDLHGKIGGGLWAMSREDSAQEFEDMKRTSWYKRLKSEGFQVSIHGNPDLNT